MIASGVNHIGINTVDLKKSEKFYTDVMGFSLIGEYDLGEDYVAIIKVNDTTVLELFRTDGSLPANDPPDGFLGLKHLAFDVDDVDEWRDMLRGKGIEITYGPANIEKISKRVMLFRAPDNVILELCAGMNSGWF